MPFTFKLSQRLARMRCQGLVVAALSVAACEQPLKVGPTQLTQIVVTPNPDTLDLSQTQLFQAFGRTQRGDSVALSVAWGATGGSVSSTGLYTAPATVGAYEVSATQTGGSLVGKASVTVRKTPVGAVTVSPATASVVVGQTVALTATPVDAAGNPLAARVVTWATSSAAVATVSGTGVVTGVAAGSATITATSDGKSGSAAITVSLVPVASVAVSPATASVVVGQTVALTATPKDATGNALAGRVVTWATSNPAVATVSGTGVVTGVAAGSATITATSEGRSGTASVTVTAPVSNPGTVSDLAVAGVTDTSATLTFTEVNDGTGGPASYDVRLAPGTITWASAASVTRGSCATPVVGSAIGAKRSCTVLGLAAAAGYQFQVVAFRGTLNTTSVVFGGLSNVANGTTATSTAPVATVTLSPASASVAAGATQQLSVTLKDAKGNILTGRTVTWATSNAALATVSGTGLVTGVAVGTATITATSEGQSGAATITVTAPPAGGTVLIQESFADGAFAARGWYDNTSLKLDSTQHISGSAASLLVHFTLGATTPTWGGATRHLFTPTSTLYVSYWIEHSSNWVGSGLPYDPHLFHVLSTLDGDYAGPAASYLDVLLEENYRQSSAGAYGRVIMQDALNINPGPPTPPWANTGGTENRAVGGCNGVPDGYPATCYADTGSPTGYNNGKTVETPTVVFSDANKTAWHHVEIYLAMNSVVSGVGQLDGIVRYWLDGVLVMEHTNVLFRTGQRATMQFKQLMLAPYMEGSPVDQTLWLDGLTVATSKP